MDATGEGAINKVPLSPEASPRNNSGGCGKLACQKPTFRAPTNNLQNLGPCKSALGKMGKLESAWEKRALNVECGNDKFEANDQKVEFLACYRISNCDVIDADHRCKAAHRRLSGSWVWHQYIGHLVNQRQHSPLAPVPPTHRA